MTCRELPPAEWGRLVGTELGEAAGMLPAGARVVVVEDAGAIVACWAVLAVVHVEGLWIDPEYAKNLGVARRLWRGMVTAAKALGASGRVVTGCASVAVRRLLHRAGAVVLPGESFVLSIEGGKHAGLGLDSGHRNGGIRGGVNLRGEQGIGRGEVGGGDTSRVG